MTQVYRAYRSMVEVTEFQHFTQSASSDTRRMSQTTDAVTGCCMASNYFTNLHSKMLQLLCVDGLVIYRWGGAAVG